MSQTQMSIDMQELDKIIELTEQIKKLEEEKKKYTDKLKSVMLASGQTVIPHRGSKIQLIKSSRTSFKKGMKESFLLFLKGKGLDGCLKLEYDIDKETLETEIAAGNITQQEISRYASITEVNSLRVTL